MILGMKYGEIRQERARNRRVKIEGAKDIWNGGIETDLRGKRERV